MKKLLLFGLLSFAIAPSAMSQTYHRVTEDRGPDGFEIIEKVVSQVGTFLHTEILCSGPGHSSCPTIISPDPNIGFAANVQEICVDYAIDKIDIGVLIGSQVMVIGSNSYYLSWTSNQARTSSSIQIIK